MWQRVVVAVSSDADLQALLLDGTIVHAHQHAAGASKKPGEQALDRCRKGGTLTEHKREARDTFVHGDGENAGPSCQYVVYVKLKAKAAELAALVCPAGCSVHAIANGAPMMRHDAP